MKKYRGFSAIGIIGIIAVVAAIGTAGFLVINGLINATNYNDFLCTDESH